jgi:hypothetical protein
MLVTSALGTLPPDSAAHDSAAGYSAARPLDFEAALLLINAVAEGAPRTRVQLEVIDRLVTAGQYAVAARLAESLSADVGAHLARIILTLGAEATDSADAGSPAARSAEAARAAVLSMLPRCSRYPRSAHATCVALAMAFPSASVAIADAVQRNAAAVAAPAPES